MDSTCCLKQSASVVAEAAGKVPAWAPEAAAAQAVTAAELVVAACPGRAGLVGPEAGVGSEEGARTRRA